MEALIIKRTTITSNSRIGIRYIFLDFRISCNICFIYKALIRVTTV